MLSKVNKIEKYVPFEKKKIYHVIILIFLKSYKKFQFYLIRKSTILTFLGLGSSRKNRNKTKQPETPNSHPITYKFLLHLQYTIQLKFSASSKIQQTIQQEKKIDGERGSIHWFDRSRNNKHQIHHLR